MKFYKNKFAKVLIDMCSFAKKKYPKVNDWTAIATIWEDGDFHIELRHNERKSIYYKNEIITNKLKDIRATKKELEQSRIYFQKKLNKINRELLKISKKD